MLPLIPGSPNSGNSLPLQTGQSGNSKVSLASRLSRFASSWLGAELGSRCHASKAALRGPRQFFSCATGVAAPNPTFCWHSALKRTQQQQTYSEDFNFLLLFVTMALLCIWEVLTRQE